MPAERPTRLLVVGGGIAALELVLAVRARAGHEVAITMVAPTPELLYRPEAVFEPFSRAARRYRLQLLADALDFQLVAGGAVAVNHDHGCVHLDPGPALPFDELVIAAGAHAVPGVEHATTVRAEDADRLHWVASELEDGSVGHVVLVAGPTAGWTLPVYELAFLLAGRADAVGLDGRVAIVTHERRPLEVFGRTGSDAVAELLDEAGVRVLCGRDHVRRTAHGVTVGPAAETLRADRVLALPALRGPTVRGLPLSTHGFVRVGPRFEVPGRPGVHAIGDAAALPVKQGGLAAQQADVVAAGIVTRAGIPGAGRPAVAPVLRTTLVTGERATDRLYLSGPLIGGEVVDPVVTRERPDWAAQKISATYLGPFLAALDERGAEAAVSALGGPPRSSTPRGVRSP